MAAADDSQSLADLSLEPPLRRSNLSDPLEQLVPRIGAQYGGFRNVTEARLKKEISEQSQISQDDGMEESSEDEDEKPAEERKGSNEAIFARRREMTAFLGAAMQDALMTVDFISLLETKSQARAADTMSLALKQAGLPNGALDHEQWQARQDTAAAEQAKLAALGRAMENLTSVADTLLADAERLKANVDRETQYWKHILSVTERGWSVYRAPRSRAVALQFGVNEAGPLFRNRGFAELMPNEDGSIRLVQNVPMRPKALRLRYRKGGTTVSETVGGRVQTSGSLGEELELQIREARDSLFEEELFHEMAVEARNMASLGVKIRDGVIHLPISHLSSSESEEFLIDMLPRITSQGRGQSDGQGEPADLTKNTLVVFQLLLCHAHRQAYRRRTKPPFALSDIKRAEIAPQILRPTLAYLTHDRAVASLSNLMHDLQRALGNTAFKTSLERQPSNFLDGISNSTEDIFSMVDKLLQPLATKLRLRITTGDNITQSHDLEVEVHTQLSVPSRNDFGTDFVLIIPYSLDLKNHEQSDIPSPPLTPPPSASNTASEKQIFVFDELDDLRLYINNRLAVQSRQS